MEEFPYLSRHPFGNTQKIKKKRTSCEGCSDQDRPIRSHGKPKMSSNCTVPSEAQAEGREKGGNNSPKREEKTQDDNLRKNRERKSTSQERRGTFKRVVPFILISTNNHLFY